ncbi:hypothetical protein MN116_006029 [Schistosoma mekongi]|uniref:Next to BRCA1 central domain-containing protein n=1 Tax=Schistosoma mekongi TaxID=38744 RepID=A0AAE1ZAT7_SCHME|nr:hypothetical protein MN116_006029 [Schistosoma mekongi]
MFDIDAKLLEQFSALGTTDKDELINQLKAVVGNELSNESCRFFLDLADWNLQRAIGAYFDFGFENSPPVSCVTGCSSTVYHPSTNIDSMRIDSEVLVDQREFDARIWPSPYDVPELGGLIKVTIENCGSCSWPEGTFLRSEVDYTIAQLSSLSADGSQVLWLPVGIDGKIPILPLPPSQIVDITLNVTPPNLQLTYLRPVIGALSFCLPNGNRFGG